MNVEHSSPASTASTCTHPVLVLAGFVLLVFCTGTAEYLVAGTLPQLADDVSVSIAAAGQTATAYVGVAIGGPIITVLTARLPRKGLAPGLGAVLVGGTVLIVFAPVYAWAIVGRAVSAFKTKETL